MTESPVTLITGGSSGIGAAAARQLLDRGHRVAVTARGQDRLDRFAKEIDRPDELLTLPGDASDYDDVRAAVEATIETFGRLDAAVANAGYATHDDIATGDPAGWRDMILTNVLGPALLVRASHPALKKTGGRIVLVGSVAGHVFTAGNIYGITKWAVTALAENTRRQVAGDGDGVGVTLVSPGGTETNFFDPVGGPPDDRPRYLSADEVAASIVWAITQPAAVDISTVIVRSLGQPV
ncbi:MAG TPA: SDR family oxidoreductase [Nocardioidaceae bacterium]|nr:SDR family oxidoreductase [Nocardioidaceae bacterium]